MFWQTFFHITLLQLRPVLLFVTIIGSYNLFGEPFLLAGAKGGPNNAGLFMTRYLYLNGFHFLKFGYAASIGYALTLIILVLSLLQLRLNERSSRLPQDIVKYMMGQPISRSP